MTTNGFTDQPDDRLSLLVHMSQAFNSSLDLEEVLNRVMDEVIAAVKGERGFVVLMDDAGKLEFNAARGMEQRTIEDPQFQISRSVIERTIHSGKPILTSDAQTDERFNIRQSVMFLKLRAVLCVPLSIKDKVIGAIYVDNRLQAGIFTKEDIELLSAIASSAAIAIENARLYQLAVEKGRLERELQMARKVQANLLPQVIPQIPGWEFATLWKPARQVGGDYYDFINTRGGKLGLVIADATDKGMPAALFMASARSIIRASVLPAPSPFEGITSANELIWVESEENLFVTLFYGLLDPQDGSITYVNAGHNPPLMFKEKGDCGELIQLIATGMPLGVEQDSIYNQQTVSLKNGDFLLLYTDGITDAQGPGVEEFGMERLKKVVLDHCHSSAQQLLYEIQKAIDEYIGYGPPVDDITLVVVKRGSERDNQ